MDKKTGKTTKINMSLNFPTHLIHKYCSFMEMCCSATELIQYQITTEKDLWSLQISFKHALLMKYYSVISLQLIVLYDYLKAMYKREMTEYITEKISGCVSSCQASQSFLISFSRTESPVLHIINHWSMRNLSTVSVSQSQYRSSSCRNVYLS